MDHNHAAQLREDVARTRAENAERRARVMRYPDLVARLARVKDPDTWSGYIPPRTDPEAACPTCTADGVPCTHRGHTSRANRSYVRRELVAIAAEALRRDTQPTLDELPLDTQAGE